MTRSRTVIRGGILAFTYGQNTTFILGVQSACDLGLSGEPVLETESSNV